MHWPLLLLLMIPYAWSLNLDDLDRFLRSQETPELPQCTDESISANDLVRSYDTQDAGACSANSFALKEGQHRFIKRSVEFGLDNSEYVIRRLPGNRYQALLNIEFTGSRHDVAEMTTRVRSCMRQMSPYMRGPRGEKLEILLLEDKDLRRMPMLPKLEVSRISVTKQPEGYRGNSRNFGTNFDCITVGHEILHHLGLCDEYPETNSSMAEAWKCRVVTTAPSYMRDMWYAFNTAVPTRTRCECNDDCKKIMAKGGNQKAVYLSMNENDVIENDFKKIYCQVGEGTVTKTTNADTSGLSILDESPGYLQLVSRRTAGPDFTERKPVTCRCQRNDSFCLNFLKEVKSRVAKPIPRATCPDGYRKISSGIGNDGETRVEGDTLIINTKGNGQSLLQPNHFAKVLVGECKGAVKSYDRCASFAYMGSGTACDVPKECYDDSYYLGTPKR